MSADEITRAEVNWLEHAIKSRTKRVHRLAPSDAVALRLIDWYRKQMGWEEHNEEQG